MCSKYHWLTSTIYPTLAMSTLGVSLERSHPAAAWKEELNTALYGKTVISTLCPLCYTINGTFMGFTIKCLNNFPFHAAGDCLPIFLYVLDFPFASVIFLYGQFCITFFSLILFHPSYIKVLSLTLPFSQIFSNPAFFTHPFVSLTSVFPCLCSAGFL